jgi:hypothetical protein
MTSAPFLSLFTVSMARLGSHKTDGAALFITPRFAARSAGVELGLRL